MGGLSSHHKEKKGLLFTCFCCWGDRMSTGLHHYSVFVIKAHTPTRVSRYLVLDLARKAHFLGYGLTFLTLFSTHTHTRTHMWLRSGVVSRRCRRTLCAGREEGFDVINIRFQLFHCELSSWVAALTDFLLLMQSHSSLPPHPFPHPFVPALCPLLFPFCLPLRCSIPAPCSLFSFPSSPVSHFPPPCSSLPVVIISVIALPLQGGDVFAAASLSNSLMLDYCGVITAIPYHDDHYCILHGGLQRWMSGSRCFIQFRCH